MTELKKIKNLKVLRILTEFVLSKYREINEKQLENEIFQMEKNEEELLIEEISKKILIHNPHEKNKEGKILEKRRSILFDSKNIKLKKKRNIELIYLTLLKFKGLKRYMAYQGLCAKDIRNTSCYIKHKFYKKGSYIVRQFEKSNALYGIINGSVEIREIKFIEKTKKIFLSIENDEDEENMEKIFKKIPLDYFMSDIESDDDNIEIKERRKYKKSKTKINKSSLKDIIKENSKLKNLFNLKKENKIKKNEENNEELIGTTLENFKLDFEEKRISLKKGMCFGEWGIVYNIPRTASIYCPEDTHIFYLEKKYFNKILLSKFLEGDMKKVNFILNRIPILKQDLKIKNILTKIPPEFYEKNHIIYTPFDDANTIYLVYKGSCIIGELPFNVKSKKDYLNKFNQIKTLSFLDEGGIAGLESSQGFEKYKYCLVIKREFTILLKLNVDYLKKIYTDFTEKIQPLYLKQNSRIEEFKSESIYNKKRIEIKSQIIKDKIREFKNEMNKPCKIIKENLLRQKKSLFNYEKLGTLTKRNKVNNQSFPFINKTDNFTISHRESSKLKLYLNKVKTPKLNKRLSKKLETINNNLYDMKRKNNTLSFINPRSFSNGTNFEKFKRENRHSDFYSITSYSKHEKKKKKITQKDIISELKLPKKLKFKNFFGRNKSNSGHYNITFISNQM